MRSLIARSMRTRPMRYWFSSKLADDAHPAVAEVVDVVDALVRIRTVLQVDQIPDGTEDVLVAQDLEFTERDLLLGALVTLRS